MSVRRLLAVSLLALGLTLVPTPSSALTSHEAKFVRYINHSREVRGLEPLRVSSMLTRLARHHSVAMQRKGRLWHNDISSASDHWVWLGQNVGYGGSVGSLHHRFMHSPGHRRNILKREANLVGVGTYIRGGRIWVTVNFEQTTPGWG
jgi:uncharacterized protein YkwD